MTPIEEVLAREACRNLVLDAAAAVDAREPDTLAALFTEDAVLTRPSGEPLRGRAAIRDVYAQRPPTRITRHVVSNLRVTLAADGHSARVQSLVLLWSGDEADAAGAQGRPAKGPQVLGEFDDRMVHSAGRWSIAQRHASFLLHAAD